MDIFGDVFLKSVYVVCKFTLSFFSRWYFADAGIVNQGEKKVGLAQRED